MASVSTGGWLGVWVRTHPRALLRPGFPICVFTLPPEENHEQVPTLADGFHTEASGGDESGCLQVTFKC